MTIGLFILAVFIQLAVVLAIFLLSLSRVSGSIVAIITVLVTAFISPWSLILGVPIALLCLMLLISPVRQAVITKPVYKALGNAVNVDVIEAIARSLIGSTDPKGAPADARPPQGAPASRALEAVA